MPPQAGTKPLKKLTKGMGLYQVMKGHGCGSDKPWAVVNLQTGDTNGRCHLTREDALAQARAMYARMGDKAKVQTEGITNAFFFSADPANLLDGTDEGVKWVEAMAPKTYVTPAYGEVVITKDNIDRFISNINDNVRGQDIAIDYEHGLDPVKGKKAAGWIRGARSNAAGNLELAVEFTEPAKEELKNKEWKYFSLEWDDEWLHPDGIIYQDVVMGGGLTNRPVAKDLMPINFSEIFSESSDYEFAVWSAKYINSLPDSSFAWIGPDGERHLPYKDEHGKIDLAHVRNMIQRAPQVKGIPAAVVSRVQAMGKRLLGAKNMSELLEIDTEFMSEIAAWERSDPGVVQPIYSPDDQPDPGTTQFVPRASGDPTDDPAIKNGWRRQTPPIAEDPFTFNEEKAREFMRQSSTALDAYLVEETTADDRELAKGMLLTLTELQDQDKIKYSEYTGICSKVKRFFEGKNIVDKNAPKEKQFTEAEAIGYLTSATKALDKIHTNAGNALIDRIEAVLGQDYRKRSMSELQTLVDETRSMLRGEDENHVVGFSATTIEPEGGKTVGELTEKDLRELRNVLDVDDDGKILEAVQHHFGELAQLRDAVSASEQEKVFAEQYPQFYAEHRKMLERDRRNTAKDFSESVKKVRRAEGLGLKTTNLGLSSAAEEKLIAAHMKFAEGLGTLEDFEDVMKSIFHGGLVQFGEVGTSGEEPLPDVDTTTGAGVATARRVFAEAVARVQKEHADDPDFTYKDAIAEASRKHPDLASSYNVALPA